LPTELLIGSPLRVSLPMFCPAGWSRMIGYADL
jgi:hypothetical protein